MIELLHYDYTQTTVKEAYFTEFNQRSRGHKRDFPLSGQCCLLGCIKRAKLLRSLVLYLDKLSSHSSGSLFTIMKSCSMSLYGKRMNSAANNVDPLRTIVPRNGTRTRSPWTTVPTWYFLNFASISLKQRSQKHLKYCVDSKWVTSGIVNSSCDILV